MQCLEAMTQSPQIIATARRIDDAMSQRIDRHQHDRGPHWRCVEAPIDLPAALAALEGPVLIDCLGVWLTNLLVETPATAKESINVFLDTLSHRQWPTVVVSNESGLGVIGADALTREFVDELGLLNQQVAKLATRMAFTVSGQPLWLKGQPLCWDNS